MASYLRGSANYVWSTTSILGKGATATVYEGQNKETGEKVAVKTFNQCSTLRPKEVQIREFEVLTKINHENIVKLLSIEEEQENKGRVIVMELCGGGSLFNILDDPENTYGLEESEFLLVLEHVCAGMKHLRDNNLVHRDLKPGNIMKFIREDGQTVYKLTDFGAARELKEDQQFHSLYGTEEYLHPDMYGRAVLQKQAKNSFGATIDLWSIGVTLYHVATGNLPFRPFGGRKNRETMYEITTKKESGVISGIQLEQHGPIEWKRELPSNCHLSIGLKKIITPLIAGLLESDSKRIWSFDRFFEEVNVVLSRKPVNIFNVNKAQLFKVYIHADEKYLHLQTYISEQTDINLNNQILLLKSSLFVDVVGENTRAYGYPKTTEDEPLFLFHQEDNNITTHPEQDLPKFTPFSKVISIEKDATQAKFACSIGHLCKRRIEKYTLACKLICDTVESFTQYINTELKELNQNTQYLLEKTIMIKQLFQMLQLSKKIRNCNLKSSYSDHLEKLSTEFVSSIAMGVQNLHKHETIENTLTSEWKRISRDLKHPYRNRAPARALTQVEELRKSLQQLVRDRATRSLTYNDEQFHLLEGKKIERMISCIKTLFEKEVFPQYELMAENFGDWYKIAQNIHLKTTILIMDVERYDNKLKDFHMELTRENGEYTEQMKNNFEQAKKNGVPKSKRNSTNQLRGRLKDIQKWQKTVGDVFTRNAELTNQLNMLLDKTVNDELLNL